MLNKAHLFCAFVAGGQESVPCRAYMPLFLAFATSACRYSSCQLKYALVSNGIYHFGELLQGLMILGVCSARQSDESTLLGPLSGHGRATKSALGAKMN
jgi:hypothetical protein